MPAFLLPIAGAVLGLIIGSFLATLVLRWPDNRSVIAGRSSCDHCGHQLRFRELIPVASFILQAGKCRRCGATITLDHIAIELSAALIGGVALFAAPGVEGLAGAAFGWLLLVLASLDVKYHWLPDRLTAILAVSGLMASFLAVPPVLLDRLIGGLAGFVSLTIVAELYKRMRGTEGLGGGDPKMLGGIGCWLGWTALPPVVVGASLTGILIAAAWRMRGKKVAADTLLPLGSLMAVAAFPLWLYQAAGGGLPY